jgi:hypothetical protein
MNISKEIPFILFLACQIPVLSWLMKVMLEQTLLCPCFIYQKFLTSCFSVKSLSTEPLSDQELFVCFMQIAISCFLCSFGNDRLDTKYMRQLGDFEQANRLDIFSSLQSSYPWNYKSLEVS